MQLILLKDVENLGTKFDVVEVKPGYGRNYLIPQGFGVVANKPNMAKLDVIKQKEAAELEARLDEFRAIAEKLSNNVIKIEAKTGTTGKIFGSVTNLQLAQALEDQLQLSVDRKAIEIAEEVKELGIYHAALNLHPKVDAKINFEVVAG